MRRFQTAQPLSAFQGDEMGFRPFRKKTRRRRRRRREPVPEYYEPEPPREVEAQLQRIPVGPAPTAPRTAPNWGPLTKLGNNVRIQARVGFRAAVVELQPGMYIVAEVPEEMVRPQIGVLPLLAPLLMLAANRALKRRMREQREAEPEVVYEPPAPRQLTGPTTTAAWVSPEDYQTVVSGCSCTQRRRR